MKHLLYISTLLSALIIAACSGRSYRRSLVVADSLSCVNPQYAVRLLDSMRLEMSSAPKYERMYYNLLRIKAADKAYIEHKSDTAILPLIEYYEKHGDKKLLSETYYYAGSVYRDMNDAPMALDYFQKALDVMPEDMDLRLRSNTCYQMGFLFLFQKLRTNAIESYRKAYYCDKILKDTVSMIACLRTIAATYTGENKMDSSLYYYKKAYNLAVMSNNKEEIYGVLGQMSDYYIEKGDYVKAKEYLMPTLKNDTIVLNKISNYNMASDIYFYMNQYDSAKYYCDELFKIGTVYAKKEASRKLIKLYAFDKKWDDVVQFVDFFSQYSDSIDKITATQSVAQMDAMYNYQIREKENLKLKIENSNRSVLIILITVFLCACVLFFIFYRKRVIQKRLELELQISNLKRIEKENKEHSLEYIKRNNNKISQLEELLNSATYENEKLKILLIEKKADLIFANEKAEREIKKRNLTLERLLNSDAYKIAKSKLEQGENITKNEWTEIDICINDIVDDFKTRLYSLCHLSEHEYRMCLLIRLGLGITEIASLSNRSIGAISIARKRLYIKIFKKEGTGGDFDSFLKSL